jgi:hypothetical protein
VVKVNSKFAIVAKKKLQKKLARTSRKKKLCKNSKIATKANTNLQKINMQIQNIHKIILKWTEINVLKVT